MERQPLIRITKIDQCLKARPYSSLARLMDETESSRRTVYRDLAVLQQMGAPIGFSREHNGYYYVPGNNFKLPDIDLTEGDLFAIILTEQAVSAIDKNYLGKMLEPSIEKLRILFQKKIKIAPSKVFSFGPNPQPTLTKNVISNIEQILKAIKQNKKIYCKYKKPGKDEPIS